MLQVEKASKAQFRLCSATIKRNQLLIQEHQKIHTNIQGGIK